MNKVKELQQSLEQMFPSDQNIKVSYIKVSYTSSRFEKQEPSNRFRAEIWFKVTNPDSIDGKGPRDDFTIQASSKKAEKILAKIKKEYEEVMSFPYDHNYYD